MIKRILAVTAALLAATAGGTVAYALTSSSTDAQNDLSRLAGHIANVNNDATRATLTADLGQLTSDLASGSSQVPDDLTRLANDVASVNNDSRRAALYDDLRELADDLAAASSSTSTDPVVSTAPLAPAPTAPVTTTSPTTTTAPTPAPPSGLTGDVVLTDKTWSCTGPVNLRSVTVTIRNVSADAVMLRSGCTGYIGRIDVVQYHGDGIHLGAAHDLVVGGGTIRCYAHDPLKHQDGIQVMGGTNVTFRGMDVGCYSANNSQVWMNDGAGGTNPPTDVVFDGGRFQGYFNGGQYGPGGSYGVTIVNSQSSGYRNVTVCPNAHTSREFYVGSGAQNPVDDNNQILSSC